MQQDRDTAGPRVQLAWGRRGAQAAAERGDILVVVDTLRFSTAAATADHHGAVIYPCPVDEALVTALALKLPRFGGTPGFLVMGRYSWPATPTASTAARRQRSGTAPAA